MKNEELQATKGIAMIAITLNAQVKELRKKAGLTQTEMAKRSGVGLRFVRDVEQGKQTVRMDKVNQVLTLFGHHIEAVKDRENSA
jgi:y4mF family transcriptional regulator